MKRQIIEINRDLCNGCGLCTGACAEGALQLDAEGKAVLVKEIFCDGLGACLDVCPTGALKVIEREAAAYDEDAATQHVSTTRGAEAAKAVHHLNAHPAGGGCPGSMARVLKPAARPLALNSAPAASGKQASELGQWPIQLHLVSPMAPYFQACDLLVAADCTAFALGSFHADLLRGKALAIACPKLDDTEGYVEKLSQIIANNTVYSITVAIMEVPCCSGLSRIVEEAVARSGKNMAIKTIVVGLDGAIQ